VALTKKQQLFVDEYLQSFNATEAAIKAGYSEKTAYSIGWENLRKPDIAEEIQKHLQASAMSADEVLKRWADTARSDIGLFSDVRNSSDLKSHPLSYLVKKFKKRITYDKDGNATEDIELELYDAQTAQQMIGKHWALLTDRNLNMNIDLDSLSNEQLERLAKGEDVYSVIANSGAG